MRKLLLFCCALAALVVLVPGEGRGARGTTTGQCGLPDQTPWWIDFGDGSVPFWEELAQPGNILAASNLLFPPKIRARGAHTVYWDMYLNKRVGTPGAPADPAVAVARANKLFDAAVASSECATPLIAENELFGAGLTTPWSRTNAQYRANVLAYLKTLAARGARPFLLVNSKPYTAGEAGDWWRQVAQVADLVREDYFPAPAIWNRGVLRGSRTLRTAFRRSIFELASIGVPVRRIGIMLGFHTERGQGGREGLARLPWLETVKWQALAARQVARETHIPTIWSWGWANWGERGLDPDKPAAACVWLWTRKHSLCNGPAAAGPGFDGSLTDGQIILQSGVQCRFGRSRITLGAISQLQALTGDREAAYTALLARLAASRYAPVTTAQILAAERAVIAERFHGSVAAYRAALRSAHATVPVARGVVADELRRMRIEVTLPARSPSGSEITSFYLSYPDLLVRPIQVNPAASWLGWRTQGLALSSIAPAGVFDLRAGGSRTVRTLQGNYRVRAVGQTTQLGAVPLDRARSSISAALRAFSRGAAYESWSARRQNDLLAGAICRRDDLPAAGTIDLAGFLPFLQDAG